MSESQTPSFGAGEVPARSAAKRPWHTPHLEEVDYTAAEGGGLGPDFAPDLLQYAS